tara:strand:+ start:280 stop:534 length:255 start_codon:yes stop_codon:yes gene_type:complete
LRHRDISKGIWQYLRHRDISKGIWQYLRHRDISKGQGLSRRYHIKTVRASIVATKHNDVVSIFSKESTEKGRRIGTGKEKVKVE